ncbi:MAG: hypothetical protein AB7F99_12755 [Vicinamibacterales bacterium]
MRWLVPLVLVAAAACTNGSPAEPSPPSGSGSATLSAPTPDAPRAGQQLSDENVTLTVSNATVKGNMANIVYRFEWSESDGFPADSRTGAKDGVVQGTGTTSYEIEGGLKPNVTYYWRARAHNDTTVGAWSNTETFVSANIGFVMGQTIYDPLTNGTTVGNRVGGTFVPGQGWKADHTHEGIDYSIPTCSSCTVQFDVTNFGKAQGAADFKDLKWISMGDGSTFDNFFAFRDHPWKMHLEQRSDGDGTGMKIVWRNGGSGEDDNPGDHVFRNDSTVNWMSNEVYRFTLRWTPGSYSVSVGIVEADGEVSNNQVWFQDSFAPHPYAPPNHLISLGTRTRSDTMRNAIWRNVRVFPN